MQKLRALLLKGPGSPPTRGEKAWWEVAKNRGKINKNQLKWQEGEGGRLLGG